MNLTDENTLACATWSGIAEPGDKDAIYIRNLLGTEDSLEWVKNPYRPLNAKDNLGQKHNEWQTKLKEFDVYKEMVTVISMGGNILTPNHPMWPNWLNENLDERAPVALWIRGDGIISPRSVSIVGARASTSYGNQIAHTLSRELTENHIQIVSGGAYGIDAQAHKGANFYRSDFTPGTICVLAGGLNHLYPKGNRDLFEEIINYEGLLISEVPPSFQSTRSRFIERSRIIAGLTKATIVIEAGLRSGAMAKARLAMDMNHPVGCIPGNITSPISIGPNTLIKEGAALIQNTEDVLNLI